MVGSVFIFVSEMVRLPADTPFTKIVVVYGVEVVCRIVNQKLVLSGIFDDWGKLSWVNAGVPPVERTCKVISLSNR